MESCKEKLQTIIELCSTIRNELKEDGNHFSAYAILALKNSNEKKNQLLTDLTSSIENLSTTYFSSFPGSLKQKMQAFIATIAPAEQDEIKKLLATMQEEIQHCYRQLIVNSNVISAHFEHMKMIYNHLTGTFIPKTAIYDEKGMLNNS